MGIGLISQHDYTPTVIGISTNPLLFDTYYICTGASSVQTLPSATGTGKQIIIENLSGGTVTFAAQGGQTINGVSSMILSTNTRIAVRDYASTIWTIVTTTATCIPGTTAGIVPSTGLPGNITGSAPAAGTIGEVLISTVNAAGINLPTTLGNTYDINTLTISAGIWLVAANFSGNDTGQTTAAYITHQLYNSTTSTFFGSQNQPVGTGNPSVYAAAAGYSGMAASSMVMGFLNLNGSAVIKNRLSRIIANGGSGYVNTGCYIQAVRIG